MGMGTPAVAPACLRQQAGRRQQACLATAASYCRCSGTIGTSPT